MIIKKKIRRKTKQRKRENIIQLNNKQIIKFLYKFAVYFIWLIDKRKQKSIGDLFKESIMNIAYIFFSSYAVICIA